MRTMQGETDPFLRSVIHFKFILYICRAYQAEKPHLLCCLLACRTALNRLFLKYNLQRVMPNAVVSRTGGG